MKPSRTKVTRTYRIKSKGNDFYPQYAIKIFGKVLWYDNFTHYKYSPTYDNSFIDVIKYHTLEEALQYIEEDKKKHTVVVYE